MSLREAAQQALEALEQLVVERSHEAMDAGNDAITALRAALEQPEQEDEMQKMLRSLGFDAQCPESIGITLRRWKDGYAAALEQPEQEPVAWCDIEEDGTIHGLRYWSEPGRREHALYTHPPRREWRGLSPKELQSVMATHFGGHEITDDEASSAEAFAHAIEAALKERNA